MRRLRVFVIALPLALMAAPILAACLSCCPPVEEFQTLDTPMPCCGEDCGTVLVAGVQDPALRASSSFGLTKIAVLELPGVPRVLEPVLSDGFLESVASSPPVPARPLLSLRL